MPISVLPQPAPPQTSVGRPRGRPPPVMTSRPWMPVGHFASLARGGGAGLGRRLIGGLSTVRCDVATTPASADGRTRVGAPWGKKEGPPRDAAALRCLRTIERQRAHSAR